MSTVALLGVNHRSAPVDLRERLAIGDDALQRAVEALRELGEEAYILSTCNRTELYLVGGAEPRAALIAFLSRFRQVSPTDLLAHCYYLTDQDAVRHLFRVASGLDSMVLGEDQILGQVRGAFQTAQSAGAIDHGLGKLLPMAIEVGRRVRTDTNISRGSLSPSSVAVSLAQRTLGDLRSRSVLVIGAGEAGKATARSLSQAGVGQILATNRSADRIAHLAEAVPATVVPYEELAETLCAADIAISCTSASEHIMTVDDVRAVMGKRPERPLLCIDIAVPRDFDPAIGDIPGVHLYNIDDLEASCAENRYERVHEASAAEAIVDEAVEEHRAWSRTQTLAPVIGTLYARAEAIRQAEVERTLGRLESLSGDDRALIDLMTSSIVKRLLHGPVSALKTQADGSNGSELARLARDLFALPADESSAADPR
jgi:glutamyl-tRNA reductase